MLNRILRVIAALMLVALVAFIDYGLRTDCPNTEGYVYCGTKN